MADDIAYGIDEGLPTFTLSFKHIFVQQPWE